jgi:hypothetical protein
VEKYSECTVDKLLQHLHDFGWWMLQNDDLLNERLCHILRFSTVLTPCYINDPFILFQTCSLKLFCFEENWHLWNDPISINVVPMNKGTGAPCITCWLPHCLLDITLGLQLFLQLFSLFILRIVAWTLTDGKRKCINLYSIFNLHSYTKRCYLEPKRVLWLSP